MSQNVWTGYPVTLEGKLRIQSNSDTLYLLTNQPFAAIRLQLQGTENGELVLLDVSTSKDEHIQEPTRIIHEEKKTSDVKPDAAPRPLPSTPLPITLTHCAAQILYAPLCTMELLSDTQPGGVRLTKTIATLLPALLINAMPIGGWKLDPHHLAAIRLQNKSTARPELDPRRLQERFYVASFQRRWPGPAGSAEGITVLYLITRYQRPEQVILSEPEPEKGR